MHIWLSYFPNASAGSTVSPWTTRAETGSMVRVWIPRSGRNYTPRGRSLPLAGVTGEGFDE